MINKPTYEDLELKVKKLKEQVSNLEKLNNSLRDAVFCVLSVSAHAARKIML